MLNKNKTNLLIKPFLRWVGGKQSIVSKLACKIPKEYSAYFEPFVGAGSLFFLIKPKNAYLSDLNFNLINTFIVVRDNINELISLLKIHELNHNKEYYLKIRDSFISEKNSIIRASIFIYLNKTCYNGLYRVNKKGIFNVPIGSCKNPNIFNEKILINSSKTLKNVEILEHSFENVKIYKNAFYYLDPPYHKTFINYNANSFSEKEQKKLAVFCDIINKKGGFFMLSNSNTDLIKDLYKKYNIELISSSTSISCKSSGRKKNNEFLIRNY